ncbi:MAG: hypothetical protein H0V73_04575 [Chloroflexi bacterium]|nr:hypothetical protein [Chloroflexota bacterium]
MADFEHSITVAVGADDILDVLADSARIPDYVAIIELADIDAVEGELDLDHELAARDGAAEARFHVDRSARRVEWALPNGDLGGSIEIAPITASMSKVTIRLWTGDDADAAAVQRMFDESVQNLRRTVARR